MTVLPFRTDNSITGPLLSKKITYNTFLTQSNTQDNTDA